MPLTYCHDSQLEWGKRAYYTEVTTFCSYFFLCPGIWSSSFVWTTFAEQINYYFWSLEMAFVIWGGWLVGFCFF